MIERQRQRERQEYALSDYPEVEAAKPMSDSREANAPAQNDPRQLFDFDLSEYSLDELLNLRDWFNAGADSAIQGDTKRRCQAQADRYQAEIDRRTDGSRG